MALTDEQIKNILQKDIAVKTILVSECDLEKIKAEYINDGWKLRNVTSANGRFKVTFEKTK